MDFYLGLEAALRRLPGTRAVAVSDSVPPGGWQSGDLRFSGLKVEGKPPIAVGSDETGVSRTVTSATISALSIFPSFADGTFAMRIAPGNRAK